MSDTDTLDVADHPAVRAWAQVSPGGPRFDQVSLLSKKRKSRVFRLSRADEDGAVIAKRSSPDAARRERSFYEDVLAAMPVRTLRLHGYLEEESGEHAWLFMEEASGVRYSSLEASHRQLAAAWLGTVHAAAAPLVDTVPLPDRGPPYYLAHLRSLRENLAASMENPLLKDRHLDVLRAIDAECAWIEAHWQPVAELCARFPRTLVHGDLSPKNVRVRADEDGSVFLPFDWESAGWGAPATDLSQLRMPPRDHLSLQPDLEAYSNLVRERWPRIDRGDVDRLAALGTLFRLLSLMDWASWSLSGSRPTKAVRTLRVYLDALAPARAEMASL